MDFEWCNSRDSTKEAKKGENLTKRGTKREKEKQTRTGEERKQKNKNGICLYNVKEVIWRAKCTHSVSSNFIFLLPHLSIFPCDVYWCLSILMKSESNKLRSVALTISLPTLRKEKKRKNWLRFLKNIFLVYMSQRILVITYA